MQTNKQTKMTKSQYVQNKIKWLYGNELLNNQFVRFIFHPLIHPIHTGMMNKCVMY